MLHRIVLFNSAIYAKADILISDANSVQIVGPNNIGKSTLIYALNFLYIIDGNKMVFSGKRKGDLTTINHYFPTLNKSFIVFEIYKRKYYCILIKKNTEGKLEYYKIDSTFQEAHYIRQHDSSDALLNFDEIIANFTTSGVDWKKFTHKREVFGFVYQKGKRNDGVVWINDQVTQDAGGLSNNFSMIYRYLINPEMIDNQTLKESLIIADNRENEKVQFTRRNQQDIKYLLKINHELKVIKSITGDFESFKKLVDNYWGKRQILAELRYAFEQRYILDYSQLEEKRIRDKQEHERLKKELTEYLNPTLQQHSKDLGKLETDLGYKSKELLELESQLERIRQYEDKPFLEQMLENLDKQRRDIEGNITYLENRQLKPEDLKHKITKADEEIERLSAQINNYANQLIHALADQQANKEKLNAILSDRITGASKDLVQQKITKIEDVMAMFDGKIRLPSDLKAKPIPSLDELKARHKELEQERKTNRKLLPLAEDIETTNKKLRQILDKIEEANRKTGAIDKLPELKIQQELLQKLMDELKTSKEETEKAIKLTQEKIERANDAVELLAETISNTTNRIGTIQNWKQEVEGLDTPATEYTSEDNLDTLYKRIKTTEAEQNKLRERKNSLFAELKNKTERTEADEQDFIRYMDSEILSLRDKEKSIEGLLKSISNQFAVPCKTLYQRFEEFKAFVVNQFNSKLRKIRISDIEGLHIEITDNERLIVDVMKIMRITDITNATLFDDQSENLNTLNEYLDTQKTIAFPDLFDIKLHLNSKGEHKVVDLKSQIESDGTNRMIRLVIILSIINRLVVDDADNKVILFIDEIGTIDEANRYEVLNFCKENGFVPISAAPLHPYDGFDRYYLIRNSSGKLVVSEKNGNVITAKRTSV
ncbi:coiled-coil domain-containing protein [Roseivirga seohaensis]|nr:hypothetical protein [Roseivirga seohaensis]